MKGYVRDLGTLQLLQKENIPSYFSASACMTLPLGKNYHTDEQNRQGVYFVDPYFEIPPLHTTEGVINWKFISSTLAFFILHFFLYISLVKKIFQEISSNIFLDRNTHKYRRYYKTIIFYRTYIKKFSKQFLLSAEYITHWIDVNMSGCTTNDDLLNYEESLAKRYSKASLVVTSRIHADLPCLGMETPVIFVTNEEITSDFGTFNTPGRLGGILDFLDSSLYKKDYFPLLILFCLK